MRDYAQVKADGVVNPEVAGRALDQEGVDEVGLDRLDRRFLTAIIEQYKGGPVGLEAIAATINDEAETLAEVVEPFLLKIGYVVRSPSGRKATAGGLRAPGPRGARVARRAGTAAALRPVGGRVAMRDLGKLLLGFGALMVILGLILLVAGNLSGKVPWLGRLPGDVYIQRGNWSFYFPLVTSLVISIVLTLLFSLFGRR